MISRFSLCLFLALLMGPNSAVLSASEYDQGIKAYSKKDYNQAREHWEEAASEGNISAAFNLGILLSKGLGGDKDVERAANLFRRAADAGLAAAQHNMALAYYQGDGVEKNPERAQIWWERAARQGHMQAQFNLGAMLWNGDGVLKNSNEGLKWFRKAAKNGSKQASAFLDKTFEQMSSEINPSEIENSAATKEADLNNTVPKEVIEALALAHAAYKNKKYEVAFTNWQYAAENGHHDAKYHLARLYEAGLGTNVNDQRAFELFKSSAESGQAQAQYHLAQYYLNGNIVDKNETLGLYWIQSAADNDDIRARDYLEQAR